MVEYVVASRVPLRGRLGGPAGRGGGRTQSGDRRWRRPHLPFCLFSDTVRPRTMIAFFAWQMVTNSLP